MTRVSLDTSVVVPALVAAHPHHAAAVAQFERAERGEAELVLSTHALAEAYATLTALAFAPRLTPSGVERLLVQSVRAVVDVVALDGDDYATVLARVAGLGLTSGAVYDALHVRAAETAGADELVTFNGRDFRRMAPAPPVRLVVL